MMIPKFRAFDKLTDTIQDVLDINFIEKTVTVSQKDIVWYKHDNLRPFKGVILMQSTGLKDKNGVEIFEGDVVQAEQYLTTTIPVRINGIVKYSNRYTMFYLDNGSERHDLYMQSLGGSIYNFEIIGSIYTNPELLEGR